MIDRKVPGNGSLRAASAALLILCALPLPAQEPLRPIPPLPLGGGLINLPVVSIPADAAWEIRFTHRFSQPINQGDIHSLFGLDSGADVGIGLAYAIRPDLQLSFTRSSLLDDYELAARGVFIQQAPSFPLSVGARAGLNVRTERGVSNRSSPFAQAILSRRFGKKLELFAVPSVVSNAGPFDTAFNVPLGAAWLLGPTLSAVAELYPVNQSLPSGTHSDFGWAVGLKSVIGGHAFEVLLSNSRATMVDQYVPGAFLCDSQANCAGLRGGDIHLGFNIERRFGRPVRRNR